MGWPASYLVDGEADGMGWAGLESGEWRVVVVLGVCEQLIVSCELLAAS